MLYIQEGRMRGQAFVTFPSTELAEDALVWYSLFALHFDKIYFCIYAAWAFFCDVSLRSYYFENFVHGFLLYVFRILYMASCWKENQWWHNSVVILWSRRQLNDILHSIFFSMLYAFLGAPKRTGIICFDWSSRCIVISRQATTNESRMHFGF